MWHHFLWRDINASQLTFYFDFVGISLSVEQWEKLKEAIPKIDQQLHDKSWPCII